MHDAPTLTLDHPEVTLLESRANVRQPSLVLYTGPTAGRRFELDDGVSVIGRAPEAQVHVDALGISRRHAEIAVHADHAELRDLGSANRTYLNDRELRAPARLRDGDIVVIANTVLRYHDRRSFDAVLHDRIYRLATIDAGTDVFNRGYMQEAVRQELLRAQRDGTPLALICFDMDRFKAVNERYGQAAGDAVLKKSAALVRAALRDGDVLGRWGGEEFTVLLKHTDLTQAVQVAKRLRETIEAHRFELPLARPDGTRIVGVHQQTISLGVAQYTAAMSDEYDLLGAADRALYSAKRSGRNCVVAASG